MALAEAAAGQDGNRVATMLTPIPTNVAGPAQRVAATHESLRAAKERHKAIPATMLQDASDFIPPALFARAARVTTSVSARLTAQAPVNVVISNVPGSPTPLYLAGAQLEAMYPLVGAPCPVRLTPHRLVTAALTRSTPRSTDPPGP